MRLCKYDVGVVDCNLDQSVSKCKYLVYRLPFAENTLVRSAFPLEQSDSTPLWLYVAYVERIIIGFPGKL